MPETSNQPVTAGRQKPDSRPGMIARAGSAFSGLVVAWCLAVTGCAGTNRAPSSPAVDPLLGGPPAPRQGAAAPTTPPPGKPASGVAALPPPPSSVSPPIVPTSSGSMAALAAGGLPTLDTNHDQLPLRIGPPPNNTGWSGQGTPPSVVLNRPEPSPDASLRRDLAPAPPAPPPNFTPTSATRFATYEQALAELTARGVKWQRLESDGETGEWKFTCSLPNRQYPNISRTYVARAAEPVTAVRAVIEQMDRER